MKNLNFLIFLVLFISGSIAGDGKPKMLSPDGPYVFYGPDGSLKVVQIDNHGEIWDTTYARQPDSLCLEIRDTHGKYDFVLTIDPDSNNIIVPDCIYNQADSIFIVSDLHGRFDLFVKLLMSHKIIDENLKWSFADNQLLVLGDTFDRGDDVTQILWFTYKLEKEARKVGGKVSFLLGNHETMVLSGDVRYVTGKYREFSDTLNIDTKELYGKDTWLGKWISSKNTVEITGKYMFVHAGISEEFCDRFGNLEVVNDIIRDNLFYSKQQKKGKSATLNFLFGNEGPVWYRGMVKRDEKYSPITEAAVRKIKKRYDVEHIIVGHTVMDEVSEFFKGSVIAVNVDNEKNAFENKSRGLMLIKNSRYAVYNDTFSEL